VVLFSKPKLQDVQRKIREIVTDIRGAVTSLMDRTEPSIFSWAKKQKITMAPIGLFALSR